MCGNDNNCIDALRNEVNGKAAYYEGRAHASLGMFRGLLSRFTGMPGRTVVVLLSAGMVASDTVGGRPDLGDFGIRIGKEASASNVNVYTVFVDEQWLEEGSAEHRYGRNPNARLARDSEILGRWLDQFSGAAGGVLFKVVAGIGFGAVNVTFDVMVEWLENRPPDFAKVKAHGTGQGSAVDVTSDMSLVANPDSTTTLNWTAEISVVGAIAGLASRMMSGIIKKLSGSFFECIKEKIEESERMQA